MMVGVDANTGQPIGLEAHVLQSIGVILTTPVGTRLMRRDFGNDVLEPDGTTKSGFTKEHIGDVAQSALVRYEPRATFKQVSPELDPHGQVQAYRVTYELNEIPGTREVTIHLSSGVT